MQLWSGATALVVTFAAGVQPAPDPDRLYGAVETSDGRRLEGWLRWDRNETQWGSVLDGEKDIPWDWEQEAERLDEEYRRRRQLERSVTVAGVRISWDEDDEAPPRTALAGVRFGHIESITVVDTRRIAALLKSGEVVELSPSSSDVGPGFRGLIVETRGAEAIELRWSDIARVDFSSPPIGMPPPRGARLHGVLTTRAGVEWTGFVAWDLDEALTTDVLDGEVGGRERDIVFGDIRRITPEGRRAARVRLVSGEEVVLRGTDDVTDRNRGIEITVPDLGRVVVPWDDVGSVTFDDGRTGLSYDAFDGGRRLRGTVVTERGGEVSGELRWDNDEASTWEMLDGRAGKPEYAIEFGRVRGIERIGATAARVDLRDGRTLVLDGSSDVGESNRGIFVRLDGGEMVLIRWRDFVRVTFEE